MLAGHRFASFEIPTDDLEVGEVSFAVLLRDSAVLLACAA